MAEKSSHERTRNYLRQVMGSVIYKFGAIIASFLAIPIMLQFLGVTQYGVWSTLLTILSWIVFFDLGIGNGLRNCVAEALAGDKIGHATKFSSSGYTLIGIISVILWGIAHVTSEYVHWQTVFNTNAISESDLRLTVQISVFFVVLNLWLGLVSALIGAVQKSAMIGLQNLISNCAALIFVFLLFQYMNSSILYMAISYGLSVFIANLAMSIWFFSTYKHLRPRLYISKKFASPLISLGVRFFIIQLAGLVIFTTDKIIITQLLGPEYVTNYDVVFKLFSIITISHAIINFPLWPAYTDAFTRNDIVWIRNMFTKQLYVFFGAILGAIGLGFFARPVLLIWLGRDMDVTTILIVSVAVLSIITVWNNVFAIFVNGIGKINLQMYTAVFGAILNIPMSIYFVRYLGMQAEGVVLATCASLLIGSIIIPLQVKRLLM